MHTNITRVMLALAVWAVPMVLHVPSATAQPVTTQLQEQEEASAVRKGFIIGFGVGAALHRADDVTLTRDRVGRVTVSSTAANDLAIVTAFKVGYAPTDQLLIHYSNKFAITRADDYDYVGLTGVGATYMMKRSSPSFFLSGSGGAGIAGNFIESVSSDTGFGLGVGGGYEFTRHLSISGDAMFVRLGGGNNHTVVMATFNYLFY